MQEKINIFTDGGSRSNPGIAGVGVHIETSTGEKIFDEAKFLGIKTNNEAEYLAFLEALQFLVTFCQQQKEMKKEISFHFYSDSKLMVEQLNRRWKIKEARLQNLAQTAWQLLQSLPYPYEITHILREKNTVADALANQAMDSANSADSE
jgi:ribonuclease HI